MANLTFRTVTPVAPSSTTYKNIPLTYEEMDGNFKSLSDTIQQFQDAVAAGYVARTSNVGSAKLPVGTTPQRDVSASAGYIRFNQSTIKFEGYNGTIWTSIGGGAVGGGSDDVFYENSRIVNYDYTITATKNAMSAGPITVNDGVVVTVPSGSSWTIV